MFLVAQMLVHFGIERGFDGELEPLLGEGAEIFSDLMSLASSAASALSLSWSIYLPTKVFF
jgi:hypothetical protein